MKRRFPQMFQNLITGLKIHRESGRERHWQIKCRNMGMAKEILRLNRLNKDIVQTFGTARLR